MAEAFWRAASGRGRLAVGKSARRLIVFTRYPEPGATKTRLIPLLGAQGAADLQRRMTEHVVRESLKVQRRVTARVEVRFAGGDEALMRHWLGDGMAYRVQEGAGLGERMACALADALAGGARSAVIVGSDCPAVTAELLEGAFEALERGDLVLGPAGDGGYYLVGLRRAAPRLFDGMPWGTASVLERTLARAEELGLRTELVDALDDVDGPADLTRADAPRPGPSAPAISVVIPALNEAREIGATLAALALGRNVETIVVDGGSTDGTAQLAAAAGARVLESARGKARQMNAGAAAASGELLVFLHADTRLPPGWDEHVRNMLADPDVALGAFRLGVGGPGIGLRLVEAWADWRTVARRLPYGDQCLCVRASAFRAVGGYPEMPLMEDYEFVRRVRRRGRVVLAPARDLASARRWLRVGVVRTSLLNQAIVAAYRLGVSPERLERWYRGRRG
jgi:hypothetical protein